MKRPRFLDINFWIGRHGRRRPGLEPDRRHLLQHLLPRPVTNGNATNAPVWTGTNQAACGSCHGLPPGGTHPAVGTALTGCAACHNQTMTAAGAIIAPSAGGKHLDGIIEASGGAGCHGASWMDTASAGFHAYSANAGISSCQSCHGANLDGVGGSATTSCASCHGTTSGRRTACSATAARPTRPALPPTAP